MDKEVSFFVFSNTQRVHCSRHMSGFDSKAYSSPRLAVKIFQIYGLKYFGKEQKKRGTKESKHW